jgi:hypothetical protein
MTSKDTLSELPPEAAAMQLLFRIGTGYTASAALQVVLKLGIADRFSSDPMPAAELARPGGRERTEGAFAALFCERRIRAGACGADAFAAVGRGGSGVNPTHDSEAINTPPEAPAGSSTISSGLQRPIFVGVSGDSQSAAAALRSSFICA